MELISIDSSCQRSSALFFNRLFSWINSHSSKVVTVPFTLCHSLSLHRRQPLSPFLSLHFPRQSRSLLAAEWSPLQCECTCRSRAHLTACQMPDVRYQRVWELTISVFVMEHFGGNMWQLATFFFFFFFCFKEKRKKNLLLLMFCVYRGLASFRLDRSWGHWLLFSSSRSPPVQCLFCFPGRMKNGSCCDQWGK